MELLVRDRVRQAVEEERRAAKRWQEVRASRRSSTRRRSRLRCDVAVCVLLCSSKLQ